jgi:excinuclease UvrABC helicase subunit UvrB
LAGLERGDKHQVLLGVTGSGKTLSIASMLARVNRPALVLAPNKTLAAQLYQEFKAFFPKNAVEYFVSYYDYYQPDAYGPQSDTIHRKGSDDQRRDRPHAPGDEVESITGFDPLTGKALGKIAQVAIYPTSHYVTPQPRLQDAIRTIEAELMVEKPRLEREGKLLEAQRLC